MATIRQQKEAFSRYSRGYNITDLAKSLNMKPKALECNWRRLGLIKPPPLKDVPTPPQKEVFVPFWEPRPKPKSRLPYTNRDLERISQIVGWNGPRHKEYPHPDDVTHAIQTYDLVKVISWSRYLPLPETIEQVKIFKTIALTWAHWKAKAYRAG